MLDVDGLRTLRRLKPVSGTSIDLWNEYQKYQNRHDNCVMCVVRSGGTSFWGYPELRQTTDTQLSFDLNYIRLKGVGPNDGYEDIDIGGQRTTLSRFLTASSQFPKGSEISEVTFILMDY